MEFTSFFKIKIWVLHKPPKSQTTPTNFCLKKKAYIVDKMKFFSTKRNALPLEESTNSNPWKSPYTEMTFVFPFSLSSSPTPLVGL